MKLMVIDGNSILNRAFYGIRPLTTREGTPTNAVYGFLTTLLRLLEEEQPQALAVTFDRREPTFRHLSDESYKAQRKGMPEELAVQLPLLKELLDAMAVPRYELAGYEADDLIGTISHRCEGAGWECVVVTGDRDSLQLVTEHTTVKLVTTRAGQSSTRDVTPEVFRQDYGFDPIHLIDLKALMGDASDNIPGVKGVGEKTAMALIQLYQSIDQLYAHMPDICSAPDTPAKPGLVKKLREGEESARHSYWLATIVTDVPLEFSPEDALRRPAKPELHSLLVKLEFARLTGKVEAAFAQPASCPPPTSPPPSGEEEAPVCEVVCESEIVTGRSRVEELLNLWRQRDYVSCLVLPDLKGVCVEWGDGEAGRAALFFPDRLDGYQAFLQAFFAGEIKKASTQVKDLTRHLLEAGLPAEGFIFDVSLAGYLLDSTAGHYELERLGASWFHEDFPKALYLEKDALTEPERGVEALGAFMSHTALVDALYKAMLPQLRETGVEGLYFDIELPLCRVLAEMELAGFLVDGEQLTLYGEKLSAAIDRLEEEIYSYQGKFNINSPKQLGEILFDRLGLPSFKKTKTGYSTSAEVLEKLRCVHPIVDKVLQYRQYAKLKSTYVDGLSKALSPDGRVRTSFQMTVTATGRLSSTEPNLQNIPTRTELGSELRRMFVAGPGMVLVDADYSQIELRLLAHISGDEAMREAFLSGEDFHTVTAAHVFSVPPAEVTPTQRRAAKAVNFGIVYGISPFSLSQDLSVSVAEAKRYMEAYFTRFPGVRRYMEEVVITAREKGYAQTPMGRRRALPELASSNRNTRAFGERVALNMPVQGAAADVIKLAMVRVARRLKAEGLAARLIMQVHDELIVECPEEEAETAARLLTEEMQGVGSYAVPLIAEAHWGKSWLEAK